LELRFHKYQGTGNDFILVDGRETRFDAPPHAIARLCDRRFGIGADGLIVLTKVAGFDFGMTYYNSDGRESTMCGNGGRCIMAFADFLSLTHSKALFLAADGPHDGEILSKQGNNYRVRIRMNDVSDIVRWQEDLFLNTGSPHLVRFAGSIKDIDLVSIARPVRYDPHFAPGGTNVNLVEEKDNGLFVRSYERGVEDETLSCGTGVTASALAFAYRKQIQNRTVAITTLGGELQVSFIRRDDGGFTDIWLEGPAVRVFDTVMSSEL
jgi:diaminopimelate epimerase